MDVLGREVESKTPKETITTAYDGNGNKTVITAKENDKTISQDTTTVTIRSYDELNRVKSKQSLGKEIKFLYDQTDGLDKGYHSETVIDFNNKETKRIFDKADRLTNSIDNGVSTFVTYYPNGNRKSIKYASGVVEEYQYNKNNLLTNLKNIKGNETLSEYSYAYNQNNQIISKDDNKGHTTYMYDSLNRLTNVKEPLKDISYTYDGSGNRETETVIESGNTTISTYNYSSTNRLESVISKQGNKTVESRKYEYYNNGNVKNEVVENESGEEVKNYNYYYDGNNNLISTEDKEGNLVESNRYDGEGLRIQRKTQNDNTKFMYEGVNPILELDGENLSVKAKNEYIGDTILSRTIGNDKYNFIYNGHGDVVNLADKVGSIKNTYYYDSFGEIEENTESVENPYKYSKYYYGEENDKYYLNSRMYDASTSRFMQQDTYTGEVSDPLSLNLYTYCCNEPLMYNDPSGHMPQLIIPMLIGAAAGLFGEWLGDYIEDKKVNHTKREYAAAAIAGAAEAGVRFGLGGIAVHPAISFGIDMGSNMLYQKIAYGEVSVKEAMATATIGLGINGLSKVSKTMLKNMGGKLSPVLEPMSSKIKRIISPTFSKLKNSAIDATMALKDTILGKGNTNNSVELACGLGGGNQFFGNLKRNYESNVVNRELRDRVLGNIEESRLAREASNYSEFAKFENSLKGVRQPVSVNANEIRFSQSSVNGADEIINSMKANGWKGDPIDVVKMSDGKMTTIDNTRVVAAREAGIDVQAIIHDSNELLPESLIDRFTTKKGVPKTWGEAIELRIGKQKASFRNNNPFGADTMERIGK